MNAISSEAGVICPYCQYLHTETPDSEGDHTFECEICDRTFMARVKMRPTYIAMPNCELMEETHKPSDSGFCVVCGRYVGKTGG